MKTKLISAYRCKNNGFSCTWSVFSVERAQYSSLIAFYYTAHYTDQFKLNHHYFRLGKPAQRIKYIYIYIFFNAVPVTAEVHNKYKMVCSSTEYAHGNGVHRTPGLIPSTQ